jgi:hypothetical protein
VTPLRDGLDRAPVALAARLIAQDLVRLVQHLEDGADVGLEMARLLQTRAPMRPPIESSIREQTASPFAASPLVDG